MGKRRLAESRRLCPPRMCTAHNKKTGEPCKNYASPGYNVCRYHGAHKKKGVDRIVHGMYSDKVNVSLSEKYEEFLDHTDTLESINSDIALMRAMMSEVLSTETYSMDDKERQMYMFLRYMKDIREATSLKDSIESQFSVSIQTLQIFLNQVLFILQDTVTDEKMLQRTVERLRNVKLLDEKHPQIIHGK